MKYPAEGECDSEISGAVSGLRLAEPAIRKWPNPHGRKRGVEVHVMRYWGIGQHWHVSVREDDNPRLGWASDGHVAWICDGTDPKTAGRQESFRLEVWDDMVAAVRKVLRRWKVTKRTHEVHGCGEARRSRWYYARSSD